MARGQTDFAGLTTDLHPLLNQHEANVEADRCYFCFDAPCVTACPTGIDVPLFIRQIHTGNREGAAKTIFDENILGGMCARVCPTETLCEQACVRTAAEDKPVKIGALQRFATDSIMGNRDHPYQRKSSTGKKVAVVGAGPAGLACAHRLALHGHDVEILDSNPKPGGLNEYGIASYKTTDNFAQREVEFIMNIGGISLKSDVKLGKDVQLSSLVNDYDAVFIGVGLGGTNSISLNGDSLQGVEDAVDFIARLRQSSNYGDLQTGRKVVVIGGGMTAIDAAVQVKMLGAEDVTIIYRRGQEDMNASLYEQNLALTSGVKILHHVMPVNFTSNGDNTLTGVECEYTQQSNGKLTGTGETFTLPADIAFNAIGQSLQLDEDLLVFDDNRIQVDADRRSKHTQIWAGGDCIAGGEDLTVSAVQDGKLAAESMHRFLSKQNPK